MILRDDHDADWTAAADTTLERRVYYAQNWRADVVALMADNGRVLERTWYEAYGTPHSSPAADLTGSADSNSDFFGVPDGVLDSVDYSCYLTLYNNSDARADLSGSSNPANAAYGRPDGTVDSVDYFFYLAIYAEGATAGRGVLSQTDLRNRKGYAGYEWDPGVQAATMLYDVRNRVYNPEIARWTRRDPLQYNDGISMFRYVHGRPVSLVDSSGTETRTTANRSRRFKCDTGRHADDVLCCQDVCDATIGTVSTLALQCCYSKCNDEPSDAADNVFRCGFDVPYLPPVPSIGKVPSRLPRIRIPPARPPVLGYPPPYTPRIPLPRNLWPSVPPGQRLIFPIPIDYLFPDLPSMPIPIPTPFP